MQNVPLSRVLCCALSAGLAMFSGIAYSQEYPPPIYVTTYVYDCGYCTNLDNDLSANSAMDTILATDSTIAAAASNPSAVEILGIDGSWATFSSDPSGAFIEMDSGADPGGGGCVETRCIQEN